MTLGSYLVFVRMKRSEIWVVENGTVRNFPGTFEEYKEELQREIKSEVDE